MNETTATQSPLTETDLNALHAVVNGCDVSDYELARRIRGLERDHGDLINVCAPMGHYDGAGHVPYLGAIPTEKGLELLDVMGRDISEKGPWPVPGEEED